MTYEEFKKELYRNLQQQETARGKQVLLLEKGSIFDSVELNKMLRMVNLSDYGREDTLIREDILCVVWRRREIVSILHWKVREVYEQFKEEGWQSVLPQMLSKIRKSGQISNRLGDRDYARESDRFIVRPLHYPDYCGELDNGICRRFGDIALVVYLLVQEDEENVVTLKLRRDITARWNVSDETLLTNALLNTCAKMPPRLYYGTDIRTKYDYHYGVFMPGERGITIRIHPRNEREGLHGYLLTTTRRLNGAVALFYPGVKERLAELLGGDYYVGFTSIHEAVVHPARHKVPSELKEAIHRTNILFERKDMLTDRVYRYSCKRKELIEV